MKHKVRKGNGFTLIELLVTTVMIAVLTVIGIVSYSSVNQRSRDVKRKSDLEQIRSALEMFKSDSLTGEYPGASGDVSGLTNDLVTTGKYLPVMPTDSDATKPYQYQPVKTGALNTGYCLTAKLEVTTGILNTCAPTTPYNYGLKNP